MHNKIKRKVELFLIDPQEYYVYNTSAKYDISPNFSIYTEDTLVYLSVLNFLDLLIAYGIVPDFCDFEVSKDIFERISEYNKVIYHTILELDLKNQFQDMIIKIVDNIFTSKGLYVHQISKNSPSAL